MVSTTLAGSRNRICAECELLPPGPPDSGTLYLYQPLDHIRSRIKHLFTQCDVGYQEPFPAMLTTTLEAGMLGRIAAQLMAGLSGAELRDSQALVLAPGITPGPAEFMRAQALDVFVTMVNGAPMLELLRENRLSVHFQPIVDTRQPERVFGYECLLRGYERDGSLVSPARIFSMAHDAHLLYYVDRAARFQAIAGAAEHRIESKIFINFNPTSIYNPNYCLRTTVKAVADAGIPADQVVFEVVESDEMHDIDHLVGILSTYRRAGFGIALDDIGSGFSSLNLLERLRPDYIKLDIGLVQGVHENSFKATIAGKLLEAAHDLGVATIAEGVEHFSEYAWLREHGADYVQGWLFARPASPPPLPTVPA